MTNVYVGFIIHARRLAKKIEPMNLHPIIIYNGDCIPKLEGLTGEITIHLCYDCGKVIGWPLIRDMIDRMKVWYPDNITIKHTS